MAAAPALTLVFDLDGTLIDTAPDLIRAANHVLTLRGLEPLAPETLRSEISFGARAMIARALALNGITPGEPELDDLLGRFLEFYANNIAVESRPFPGLIDLLEGYQGNGVTLAVCTNKREDLSRILLDELGLTAYFRAIAGRDTFPVCKPHPDHLLSTIRLAGGEARRAIMVGDSEVDVATAKAANVPVVGVTFGYRQAAMHDLDPDALIDHYSEFPAAIEGILSKRH
jgi:phosphoglycolate phosphatase